MSAEIIIILVGAVFILLAIFALSNKLRVPIGALGILLMIYGGYSKGMLNTPGQIEQVKMSSVLEVEYPAKNIQVISPIEGESVDCRTLTMGVYPDSHDKDIWVVLKPSNNKYYPQSDHTNTSYKRNGEWQVITRFGGDQDEAYDIIVYETDASASEFFSTTIQGWKDVRTYPGLEEGDLPSGAVEVDRITVSLKENCRGVF